MLFSNVMLKYYSEAGADGAESGGSGGESAKTYTEAEVAELISGLKAKNDELMSKVKAKSEADRAEEAERRRIEQETAKKNGQLDELEKSLRSQYDAEKAQLTSKQQALQSRITGAEKKAILSSLAADFIDAESVDLIGHMVSVELDDDGNTVTKFTGADGQLLTTDAAEFRKIMRNNKAIARLLKADDTNGGGSQGGKAGAGGNVTMKRPDFESLNPTAKRQFVAKGGSVID